RRSSAWSEQRLHKPRVTGSNPVAAIDLTGSTSMACEQPSQAVDGSVAPADGPPCTESCTDRQETAVDASLAQIVAAIDALPENVRAALRDALNGSGKMVSAAAHTEGG